MTPLERKMLDEIIEQLELHEKGDRKTAIEMEAKEDMEWAGYWNGRCSAFGMALFLIRQLRDATREV